MHLFVEKCIAKFLGIIYAYFNDFDLFMVQKTCFEEFFIALDVRMVPKNILGFMNLPVDQLKTWGLI